MKEMLKVCCAIIEHQDKILVAQRSETMLLPLQWEFPWGKVEVGETVEECIVREIKEELAMDITVVKPLTPVIHHYDTFSLELIPFVCSCESAHFEKKEHKNIVWSDKQRLMDFEWAAADIPIVQEYLKTVF